MRIDFNALEISVTLTPWRRPRTADGGAKRGFVVHSDYGNPKTRFMQGIADKVGGPVIYLEAWRPGEDRPSMCVPVAEFRGTSANGGSGEGNLRYASDFVNEAMVRGAAVTAMGSSRVRYEIGVRCTGGSRDDAADASAANGRPPAPEGALRRAF